MSREERPYQLTISGSANEIRVIAALADLYWRYGPNRTLDSAYPETEVYSLADALGWFTLAVLDLTEAGDLAAQFKEMWDATIARQWLDVASHMEQAAAGIRAGIVAPPSDPPIAAG